MNRRSQTAIEFMIIFVFIIGLMSLFMVIIGAYTQDLTRAESRVEIDNFAKSITSEFEILQDVEGGFKREVIIPSNLLEKYNVTIIENYLSIQDLYSGKAVDENPYYYELSGDYEYTLNEDLDGNLHIVLTTQDINNFDSLNLDTPASPQSKVWYLIQNNISSNYTIDYMQDFNLTWASSNIISNCVASDDWGGIKSASGYELIIDSKVNKLFTLDCKGIANDATNSFNLFVNSPLGSTLTFYSSPSVIAFNTSTNLSWQAQNMYDISSCTASGNWSGTKNVSGLESTGNLITNKTYILTCNAPAGTVIETAFVQVLPLPEITFNSEFNSLSLGESTNLTWNVKDATSCFASGNWSGEKNISGGYSTGNLDTVGTYTYNLECEGPGGNSSKNVEVVVGSQLIPFDSSYNPCPGFKVSGEFKCVYDYTGNWEDFNVGGGISKIKVKAWGSSGPNFGPYNGGGGAYIEFESNISETDIIQVSPGYASYNPSEMSILKLNNVNILIAGGGGKPGGYWNGGGWQQRSLPGAGGILNGENAQNDFSVPSSTATRGKPGTPISNGQDGCCINYHWGGSYWQIQDSAGGYFNSGKSVHGRSNIGSGGMDDGWPFNTATGGGSSLVPSGGFGSGGTTLYAGNRNDIDRGSAAEGGNSGRIVIYYGGEFEDIIIDSNLYNYNIATELGNPWWPVDISITVNSGVTIGSNYASISAFTTGSLPTNSNVTIINNGQIIGAGGHGGAGWHQCYGGSPSDVAGSWTGRGANGGTGIYSLVNLAIENNGLIAGGGGGGAGSGGGDTCGSYCNFNGGSGGGGAGYQEGTGVNGAQDGTLYSGGIGSNAPGGPGGTGGALGASGGSGSGSNGAYGGQYCSGQSGGLGGYAIEGWDKVTLLADVGDIRGREDIYNINIDSDTYNYNLASQLGNPSNLAIVFVTVDSGVTIGSTSTSTPAFTTGNLPSGSIVNLVNNGNIIGAGGKGGGGGNGFCTNGAPTTTGENGGNAIEVLNSEVAIDNSGLITGGGGGGAGGAIGCAGTSAGGGGGGGGAGSSSGVGGGPGSGSTCGNPSQSGSAGSSILGGSGGLGGTGCYGGTVYGDDGGGVGGKGGNLGESGAQSIKYYWSSTAMTGTPGSSGYSVKTNGNSITWLNIGDRRGPIN